MFTKKFNALTFNFSFNIYVLISHLTIISVLFYIIRTRWRNNRLVGITTIRFFFFDFVQIVCNYCCNLETDVAAKYRFAKCGAKVRDESRHLWKELKNKNQLLRSHFSLSSSRAVFIGACQRHKQKTVSCFIEYHFNEPVRCTRLIWLYFSEGTSWKKKKAVSNRFRSAALKLDHFTFGSNLLSMLRFDQSSMHES